jgi:hypothetical protein
MEISGTGGNRSSVYRTCRRSANNWERVGCPVWKNMCKRSQHADLIGCARATAGQNQCSIRFGARGGVHDDLEDLPVATA